MMKHQHHIGAPAFAPKSTAYDKGKYGRMFPWLPPQAEDDEPTKQKMIVLAKAMKRQEGGGSNARKPAGYTYLGQFISHDLTFDPTSIKERQIDPEQLNSFRTPALDLDSVYGSGPFVNPYFYENFTRFRLSKRIDLRWGAQQPVHFHDVPRLESGVAVIADPRNDENLFLSQLHVAFLHLHNHFEAGLPPHFKGQARFLEAQKLLRWHYQYVILHDYLNVVLDPCVVQSAMPNTEVAHGYPNLQYYDWRHEPFIPLEFSGAVFRFGHSQVREEYQLDNIHGININVFDKVEGSAPKHYISWKDFFDSDTLNITKAIDGKITEALFQVPGLPGMPDINLPYQNLSRGLKLQLPSGQAIARAMGLPTYNLDLSVLEESGLIEEYGHNTPLWLYTLLEADGHLGPVGSRIVAEVIVGIIQGDKTSYLNHDPKWVPEVKLPTGEWVKKPNFTMADLLQLGNIWMGATIPPSDMPQPSL